jgi:cytosine deaminase
MTLLTDATLADGSVADVSMGDGLINEVGPPGTIPVEASTYDLTGYLLLPGPADPHAHFDKAMSADQVQNPRGDLTGAIESWAAHYAHLSVADITERARRVALTSLSLGYAAVRTHVDVADGIGTKGVEALLAMRRDLGKLMDLQVCGLVSTPVTGSDGAGNRAALEGSLEMGIDLVGGAPYRDPDPVAAVEYLLGLAFDTGKPIDLHMDETLDRKSLVLRTYARLIRETGVPYGATAGHCVSLSMQPLRLQAAVAREVAASGISVVANPQTNLYLQARDRPVAPPRGLTAVSSLLAAGVNLAAGTDNIEDPFNVVGRPDPLEVAALMVMAGHLTPAAAYHTVSAASRKAMGLPVVDVAPGSPADLLAVRGSSLRGVIAAAGPGRLVFKSGRLVARTDASTWILSNL